MPRDDFPERNVILRLGKRQQQRAVRIGIIVMEAMQESYDDTDLIWLGRLARALLGEAHAADLVQDTVAAMMATTVIIFGRSRFTAPAWTALRRSLGARSRPCFRRSW